MSKTEVTGFLVTAIQLPKDTPLSQVEDVFKAKLVKSIDSSYSCQIVKGKNIFFYKFSVIVFTGYSDEEIAYYYEQLGGSQKNLESKSEQYEVVVNPYLTKEYVLDDTSITIKAESYERLEIIAFSLAHSVAMDYYEGRTEELLQKMNFYDDLKKYNKIKLTDKEAMKLIAEILSNKHRLVSELYLFDKPDIIWDDIELERLYHALYAYFDIDDRFKSIEYKNNLMNDNITFLHDVIDTRKAHTLELIVVFLIAFEVLFTLGEFIHKYFIIGNL
ncbi:MAG: hypothetical protein HHAS10_00670 [Candidatus Altimarinota bacterium]